MSSSFPKQVRPFPDATAAVLQVCLKDEVYHHLAFLLMSEPQPATERVNIQGFPVLSH